MVLGFVECYFVCCVSLVYFMGWLCLVVLIVYGVTDVLLVVYWLFVRLGGWCF